MLISDVRAQDVFRVGDRVEISVKGMVAGIVNLVDDPITGTVVGFGREFKHCVRVRRKDRKKPNSYAWWFWQRVS